MALNRITSPDMVNLSVDLITPGKPQYEALHELPEGSILVPRIEDAHYGVIAAQPPNDAKIAELTGKLTIKDVRHDTLVRSIDGRIESELLHVNDPAAVEALTRARIALFPTGLTIINASYGAQAGEVQMRAKRVDDSVRATLARLHTYDGRTCADLYDELQEVAAEIGALEPSAPRSARRARRSRRAVTRATSGSVPFTRSRPSSRSPGSTSAPSWAPSGTPSSRPIEPPRAPPPGRPAPRTRRRPRARPRRPRQAPPTPARRPIWILPSPSTRTIPRAPNHPRGSSAPLRVAGLIPPPMQGLGGTGRRGG